MKKFLNWLLYRPVPPDPVPPTFTEEELNLKTALRLVRRIKQIREQCHQWSRRNQRWARADDMFPMPHTTEQKKELEEWMAKERAALTAYHQWFNEGKKFDEPIPDELKDWMIAA